MSATARTQIGGEGTNSPKVFTSTGNPTVSNDINDGALPGDIWVNTTTPAVLICTANALGAATWATGVPGAFPGTAITALTNNSGGTPSTTLAATTDPATITDSTGGTPATTFAAITAGAGYAQADMVSVKNALAQIALDQNADRAALVSVVNDIASIATQFNALLAACKTSGIAS